MARGIARALAIDVRELPAVASGFALFFLLFCGYYVLRPVRETMGVAGGVDNLPWLFTATFVVTLAAQPLFGWVVARVQRHLILPVVFGFFAGNLLVFVAAMVAAPDNLWLARSFYVWLSVFNLIAVSVAWSVLVDVFDTTQAQRLFGVSAAGASLGGLVGPALAVMLVGPWGHAGLLALSACLLLAAAAAAALVRRQAGAMTSADDAARQPLGGSPLAGMRDVLHSPYLLRIALFMALLACVSTFLYVEQARIVAMSFPDRAAQTRVFGTLDAIVQGLSIGLQLFVTGRIARRQFGIGVLLVAVPMVTMLGFLWLALAPGFAALAVVMVLRRAGEYGLVRPGREMLYSVMSATAKYRAKNFNDTVVYRGADALAGWLKAMLDAVAQLPAVAMLAGAVLALAWAVTGGSLARRQRGLARTDHEE